MNFHRFSLVLVIASLFVPLLLLAAYFVLDNPLLRPLSLALAAALVLIEGLYFPMQWSSSGRRFQARVEYVQSLLFTELLARLKEEYHQLYVQYEKLPAAKKYQCYNPLVRLREQIEELIQSAKKLETLAQGIGSGTLEGQQRRYEEMSELYQKLPRQEQKQWDSHLRHAKELLEKGQIGEEQQNPQTVQ